MEKERPGNDQINDADRTRRRLLKLALWIPPAILTLSSRAAWAQAKTSKAAAG
ncbi:MAG TPA: hypothetical protein ACFYED_00465 [Candidatus Tripitaka californicus]|uniref:hypothetical protein n=1 Tax=Candidatus Tripitaka californicus TaxID=3367616 RepID=UPI0040294B13|nr:hypothetical protein [Planctomycetota bacterium]